MPDSDRDKVGLVVGTLAAVAIMAGGAVGYWYVYRGLAGSLACLGRARAEVVSVDDSRTVNRSLVGRTVHMIGDLRIGEGAEDRELGVRARVVCLVRAVRFFQWVEEEVRQKQSEPARYDYHRRWVRAPVDSGQFHYSDARRRNSVKARINPNVSRIPAREVFLGGYRLDDAFKCGLKGDEPLQPEVDADGLIYRMLADGNRFYLGADPKAPEIGDVRVDFFGVAPGLVSLVGRLDEGGVLRALTDCGWLGPLISRGEVAAEDLLGGSEFRRWLWLWGARAGLLAVYGLACLLLSRVWGWRGWGFGLAAALAVGVIMAAALV